MAGYVIGLDGGGTKTELSVVDVGGKLIKRVYLGALNPVAYPESPAVIAKETEKYVNENCLGICVATAGVADEKNALMVKAEFSKICKGKIIVRTDIENLMFAALDKADGLMICAGTGSVGIGQKSGVTARAGGRGHVFDDGGSAYAIGKDILAAVIRASDGRGEETALSKRIFEICQTEDIAAITARYTSPACKKSDIAALAALLLDEGIKGDGVVESILSNAAKELASIAFALMKRLELDSCPIAFYGGMISRHNSIFQKTAHIINGRYPQANCFLWGGGKEDASQTDPAKNSAAACAARYLLSFLNSLAGK